MPEKLPKGIYRRGEILWAQAADFEQQSFALQELCVEAGLLVLNDHGTDPLPLLRMFLPV